MYVINQKTKIIDIWADTEINHKRLNSGKYGVELYTGEVQKSDIDGLLYAKEFCPMKTDDEKLHEAQAAKLQEATDKAFEYRNKTGLVSFDGRPVIPVMPLGEQELAPETITVHTELLNQDDMFQRVIGFQQGIFTEDQIYNTKEDIPIYLNAQEAQAVYFAIVARAQKLWVEDYMTYKSMIEAAKTADEVNAIVIDYDNAPERPSASLEGEAETEQGEEIQ